MLFASPVLGQSLQPKRFLAVDERGCPSQAAVQPQPRDRDLARRLLVDARDAALIGDRAVALSLFAEAARADPSEAEIAYYRGRLLEETADLAGAAREYCRFLALASASPDEAEVRQRLATLEQHLPSLVPAEVVEQFEHGLAYFDQGDLRSAEAAFSYVVREVPAIPEAYFNRALVHISGRRGALAQRDLETYLALAPGAPDRDAVSREMRELGASTGSAQTALLRGLLLPGLGQYTTDRAALGLLVTAGAGGAVLLALQSREVERTGTFLDPFDNPRDFVYQDLEHPYRTAGIVAAVAITALGAVEAYIHLRRTAAGSRTTTAGLLLPSIRTTPDGTRLGFEIALPARK